MTLVFPVLKAALDFLNKILKEKDVCADTLIISKYI